MSRYKKESDEIRKSARNEPINILVWGPGEPGKDSSSEESKAYRKRSKIKCYLGKIFEEAEIVFSEDKVLQDLMLIGQSQFQAEALQAKISHVVLALDLGIGVVAELTHFILTYPWFRDKVYVFLPEQYVSSIGLVATHVFSKLEKNRIIGFSSKEFDECTVATDKAVQVVDTVAMDLRMR